MSSITVTISIMIINVIITYDNKHVANDDNNHHDCHHDGQHHNLNSAENDDEDGDDDLHHDGLHQSAKWSKFSWFDSHLPLVYVSN